MRYKIAIVPALVFWVVSMIFFILGLSFGDRTGYLFWIAVALSLSNTVIQIIGNDADIEEIGYILFAGWIASYALGIGSNVNSLLNILQVPDIRIEWTIAVSLGTMIEIMPERLFVLFWRSMFPRGVSIPNFRSAVSKARRSLGTRNDGNKHQKGQSSRPSGMPRAEWQAELARRAREEKEKASPDEEIVAMFTDPEFETR